MATDQYKVGWLLHKNAPPSNFTKNLRERDERRCRKSLEKVTQKVGQKIWNGISLFSEGKPPPHEKNWCCVFSWPAASTRLNAKMSACPFMMQRSIICRRDESGNGLGKLSRSVRDYTRPTTATTTTNGEKKRKKKWWRNINCSISITSNTEPALSVAKKKIKGQRGKLKDSVWLDTSRSATQRGGYQSVLFRVSSLTRELADYGGRRSGCH